MDLWESGKIYSYTFNVLFWFVLGGWANTLKSPFVPLSSAWTGTPTMSCWLQDPVTSNAGERNWKIYLQFGLLDQISSLSMWLGICTCYWNIRWLIVYCWWYQNKISSLRNVGLGAAVSWLWTASMDLLRDTPEFGELVGSFPALHSV